MSFAHGIIDFITSCGLVPHSASPDYVLCLPNICSYVYLLQVYDWLDKILVESAKTSAEDDVYKKKAKTTTLLPGPAV